MAQVITVNQNKGSRGTGIIVVRSDATGYLSTSASSPAANRANTAGETISNWYVAEAVWSCSSTTDTWTINRGDDTVWTSYGQNGYVDFQANQMRLETGSQSTANVVFTLSGTGNIILKMHKNSGA